MLTRRRFLTAAAAAGLVPVAGRQTAAADDAEPGLTAYLGGEAIGRDAVLEWEARRLRVAAERLRGNLPAALAAELDALVLRPAQSTAEVARDRERLAAVKMRMGEAEIRKLMAPDLAVSGPASEGAAAPGEWAVSSAGLASTRGTAGGFARWFTGERDRNDERAMLAACPDHYVIRTPRAGVQEVIEVTGGAVLAARFVIDYADTAGVPIARDQGFPIDLSGWARGGDGVPIGAVRHQFRDDPRGGFAARLAIAFPAVLPPWMISEHRWHLACEFSNWVLAYLAGRPATAH
ncbi:hypothetical protein [Amycolatopsis echigonensis]|uniref:Uncharacterized protein n=1 Tax=Amycolatopsis echigonensis TaxID=2576905 RepID=A0A8E1T3C8_9PSEU|nr:hypothetical protein [Amycolatopsis echigonensis]MBB2497658.1 hypothetical protein [Amycolatopsis echigonensis]